jgi:hypothetical protein
VESEGFLRFILDDPWVSKTFGEGLLLLLAVLAWVLLVSPRLRRRREIWLTNSGVNYPQGFQRRVVPWSDIVGVSTHRGEDGFSVHVELRGGGSQSMRGPRSKGQAQTFAAEILYYAENADARSILPVDTGQQPERNVDVPAHALGPYLERVSADSSMKGREAWTLVAKMFAVYGGVIALLLSVGVSPRYALQAGMVALVVCIMWPMLRRLPQTTDRRPVVILGVALAGYVLLLGRSQTTEERPRVRNEVVVPARVEEAKAEIPKRPLPTASAESVRTSQAAAQLSARSDACPEGFVWREASPSDHVCVTPATRAQTLGDNAHAAERREPNGGAYGPETCRQGYVWREAFPGDYVCVGPEVRAQALFDNRRAKTRLATTSPQ